MRHCTFLLAIVFCALTSLGAAQTPKAPKPPIGVPAAAKFFNGRWYHVYQEKVDWARARAKCQAAGGQLVVIPDAATWDFVKSLTQTVVWLGATDEKVEGEWVWVDGSKMTFTAWGPVEPNNTDGAEHYLTLLKGAWNDAGKEALSFKITPVVGYICEWKAK